MNAETFAVGSLVRARGREWVVLPESSGDMLILQPLGSGAGEKTGIYLPLESDVQSATFALPDPAQVGDARSGRLLREAARLGFRSSAGPFRSFGNIAVEPRPYQLVPLLLALQLDPVRLLIADDVGIGKTIEAGLIARELLDRGEISGISVLCPPHLAEQWQRELSERFHIEAALVLPSTVKRLEQPCGPGQSLFEFYPNTVVSLDFIKSERRRDEFARAGAPFIIVDEAHTCAQSGEGTRQQRHRLLQVLAQSPDRHIVLVTATPHSGNEDAFRSLLQLLRPDFAHLPQDLSGAHNEKRRRDLARHLVQRRRADIRRYLDEDTPFPEREEGKEIGYHLSPEYKRFFDKVLRYARETVRDESGGKFRQRVRWWSALSLLRALASSPAAAAATLRSRARNAAATSIEEANEIGRRAVLDLAEDDGAEGIDLALGSIVDEDGTQDGAQEAASTSGASEPSYTPTSSTSASAGASSPSSRRLQDMAREADALRGEGDLKLSAATKLIRGLLDDGFSPIVFCRFINTAEYLAEHLRARLKGVEIESVTGLLPPDEREARVLQLATASEGGKRRVLVATDCLSEGINLQGYFDAVLHYDLSWNPTRHEQREGRVDRYGQHSSKVRVATLYGVDNQIDGIVLDVLLRKHKAIRTALGVSVPVPADSDAVIEAIFEGLLLRESGGGLSPQQLTLFGDELDKRNDLHVRWDSSMEREKVSRSRFSHGNIAVEDVAREVAALREALGGQATVEAFTRDALQAVGAPVAQVPPIRVDLSALPLAVREPLQAALPPSVVKAGAIKARFKSKALQGEVLVGRTHPLVSSLASFLLESALDSQAQEVPAARCGAMRTAAVSTRTTLLLVRMRFHIITGKRGGAESQLLAEDCALLAFRGSPQSAEWLSKEEAEALLDAKPAQSIERDIAANAVRLILNNYKDLEPALEEAARERGQTLLEAHRRVRVATRSGLHHRIEPQLPPDVLGVWVFLPQAAGQ